MLVFLLFFIVITVGAAVLAVQADRRRPDRQADEMLAARFARGDIDADEYRHRRALLRDG